MPVKPTPEGYHTATPYLIVQGAARAIDFYKRTFGAIDLLRMDGPEGKLIHAEIKIGDSPIMLADEFPEFGFLSPKTLGGTPVSMLVYVPDVDAAFARALDGGATELRPVSDQYYGDRNGTLRDPFGHMWTIATHIEDVAPDELERRHQAIMELQGNASGAEQGDE
jgi:PhnB protein